MKKLIFLLAFLPAISFGQFIEKDKQMHLLAGATFAGLGYEIAVQENVHPFLPAVGLATFMGIVKETIDYHTYGKFDFADLGFTVLGGLASFAVIELMGGKSGYGMFVMFGSGISLYMVL
jgi:hypothetical protein